MPINQSIFSNSRFPPPIFDNVDSSTYRSETHLCSVPGAQGQGQRLLPRSCISTLQNLEFLGHPDKNVTNFGQSISLADTNAWATIKGQIPPAWLQFSILPALWTEFVCVWSVYVCPSMHGVYVVGHHGTFGHEDW